MIIRWTTKRVYKHDGAKLGSGLRKWKRVLKTTLWILFIPIFTKTVDPGFRR